MDPWATLCVCSTSSLMATPMQSRWSSALDLLCTHLIKPPLISVLLSGLSTHLWNHELVENIFAWEVFFLRHEDVSVFVKSILFQWPWEYHMLALKFARDHPTDLRPQIWTHTLMKKHHIMTCIAWHEMLLSVHCKNCNKSEEVLFVSGVTRWYHVVLWCNVVASPCKCIDLPACDILISSVLYCLA